MVAVVLRIMIDNLWAQRLLTLARKTPSKAMLIAVEMVPHSCFSFFGKTVFCLRQWNYFQAHQKNII